MQVFYWCILTIHAENQISSESSTVELIKQLLSPAISILVSVLIAVYTIYMYPRKSLDGPTGPPTLPQLLHLKIPQYVGTNYFEFGVLLLNDYRGFRVMNFEQECLRDLEMIVWKILQDWLDEKGVPVTWKSLIEVLRHIEHKKLADQIEQASQQKEMETQLPFGAPGE